MMKHKILFIATMAVFSPLLPVDAQRLTDAVDPFIGSGGHGHVFVGASLPFGGVTVGRRRLRTDGIGAQATIGAGNIFVVSPRCTLAGPDVLT